VSLIGALGAAQAVAVTRAALGERADTWIVGGAVRDAIVGRAVTDLDLVVADGEEEVARLIARSAGGVAFELSPEFRTWRALSRDRDWHVDVSGLRGPGIEFDLGRRDFTVNAIAIGIAATQPLDPYAGIDDA
jgi:tRNA nucleotidyltransferase/poly(A) polymerase